MAGFRSTNVLALPPQCYGKPRGSFWQGVKELDRYPPTYKGEADVFEEYMDNASMRQSRHVDALARSSGLMELHYDTMRKKQQDRAAQPPFIHGPTMDRPYRAAAGYGGFIPGKDSCNVVGCTAKTGKTLAMDQRGKTYKPPGSGVTFSIGRSSSLPMLSKSDGFFRSTGGSDSRGGDMMS